MHFVCWKCYLVPATQEATKTQVQEQGVPSYAGPMMGYGGGFPYGMIQASTGRYGRPMYDFAGAPSLFVTEDLRQEDFALAHRSNVNSALGQSEVYEAEAVAVRRQKEAEAEAALQQERAAARYASETREIERSAVSQRAALEAKYRDAAAAAEAAMAQAEEYRQMLQSAGAEQNRAQAEHIQAARQAEEAAAIARDTEFGAVTARLANDNCFAERRVLESQGARGPTIESALGARSPYINDGARGPASSEGAGVQTRQRSSRAYVTPNTTYSYA